MPVVHGGLAQGLQSFARFSHTVGAHPHADYRLLDAVQPEAAGKHFSTGQVTSNAGATLLLAVRLVTGRATGFGTTGSTPSHPHKARQSKRTNCNESTCEGHS